MHRSELLVVDQRGLASPTTLRTLAGAASRIALDQSLSAATTFVSKTVRDPVAQAEWIRFIDAYHRRLGGAAPNGRVLRKPQRNYGFVGRTVRERVTALTTHYEDMAAQMPTWLCRSVIDLHRVALGRIEAKGTTFSLWLGSSLPFGQKQEGELTVWLTDAADVAVSRMALTIGRDGNGRSTLTIGGVQGLNAGDDKKRIVTATRTLSGLRPKDAVLVGVQAMAKALRIDRVLAVSNATHVLAAEWRFSDSVIRRDYDGFWIERGGVAERGIGFELPTPDYEARVRAAQTPRLIDLHRARLTAEVVATLSG